ncbi:hypothetical protein [Pelagicoccus sp. SDUM812005]|uniref:hypothetical protein n=1 Tax=Pelagicoccus sp. SDUM812005 TaxID=3041257 RepID=UPI00280F1F32|nr:hypothetical protein [Pelagicoccus sp. SDUM812005]MDQ8182933.1 hypothetical protein [Pelagicoccus sp. SDUM812005]
MKSSFFLLALFLAPFLRAEVFQQIGAADFSDWSGVQKVENESANVPPSTVLSYTYSQQNRVYYPGIKRDYWGDSADWTPYSGIAFELYSPSNDSTEATVVMKVDPQDYNESNPVSTAKVRIAGQGWRSVYVPWELFDIDAGQKWGTLFAIRQLELSFESPAKASHKLRDVRLVKGAAVALEAPIRGISSAAGTEVTYQLEVGNTTRTPQSVQLRIETLGWESMAATLEPNALDLAPGESQTIQVTVVIPEHLPTGIREKQTIKAIPNGNGAATATLELTTAVRVPTPNIVFTAEKWQAVRDKVDNYDWAKEGLEGYTRRADRWQVPAPRTRKLKGEESLLGQSVFSTDGREIFNTAIAYQLTGKTEYAAKCLEVLRHVSDPDYGYPATLVGGSNSFVGEGKFWQATGRAYDMIRDSELVTAEDAAQIEATFRLFAERTIQGNTRGAISNWNVAEITAALYCALNLQDWHLIDQLLTSPTGIYKHLEHGIMSDGWWYECAVGYNTWVASEFSEIAIALEPWGINFKDMTFPIGTTKHFSLLASRRVGGQYGMQFEKWGKIEKNHVSIKDMWDASIPFLDFRGVVPAINDAVESMVSGKPYELAYYLYRDPEYAAIINRGDKRDLLYGVPDLPEVTSEKMKVSAYADNMGIVQLRSQTPGRPQSEQIQAALHYGSHGGYHGHFDRTNLVSMMRHGRSFWGPLTYWYGYGSYLYKFLKQTSTTKNMVVVDEKQQEPVPNRRTLFHSGEMMQATVVETDSRWSWPPYGGIVYDKEVPFSEKMWEEGRSIPISENPPEYGAVTGYTEPVLQRRAMLVMDDYILLADYLKGEKEHQFDWMFQAKGFKGIQSDNTAILRRSNQMSENPIGSAQFVTDCVWYETEGTAHTRFEQCWGEGCDNEGVRLPHSLDGDLKINVFNAWPRQAEIMIGTAPESHGVNKKLWYSVSADGETLLDGKTGAWILGSQNIDLDLSGKKQLVLRTKVDNDKKDTIFWGNPVLITKDGRTLPLFELAGKFDNTRKPEVRGEDYYGGPIKIGGEAMPFSIPGMPANIEKEAVFTLDLEGLDAVRFQAKIGGDFPLGDESSRFKTIAVRTHGREARYLTVIEPHERESMIKAVTATGPNEIIVELADGRTQEITIEGLDSEAGDVQITAHELSGGKTIRSEKAGQSVSAP